MSGEARNKCNEVIWSWWAEDSSQGNYDKYVEYIDFAAENGWDYVCLDVGWRAIEGRLKGLCDYAASKNVGIFVWINYRDMKELSEIDRFGDETADNENYTYYEAESSNTLRGTAAATIFPLPFRK